MMFKILDENRKEMDTLVHKMLLVIVPNLFVSRGLRAGAEYIIRSKALKQDYATQAVIASYHKTSVVTVRNNYKKLMERIEPTIYSDPRFIEQEFKKLLRKKRNEK